MHALRLIRSRLATLALAPCVLAATGCPSPQAPPAAAASGVCERVTAQCKLPGSPGVLGVCEHAGPEDARLVCRPQH